MNTLWDVVTLPITLARDWARVWRGPLPRHLKKRVLWTQTVLTVRAIVGPRVFTGSILGYQLAPMPVANLAILFREIFVDLEYYFESPKTAPPIIDCGSNIGM